MDRSRAWLFSFFRLGVMELHAFFLVWSFKFSSPFFCFRFPFNFFFGGISKLKRIARVRDILAWLGWSDDDDLWPLSLWYLG